MELRSSAFFSRDCTHTFLFCLQREAAARLRSRNLRRFSSGSSLVVLRRRPPVLGGLGAGATGEAWKTTRILLIIKGIIRSITTGTFMLSCTEGWKLAKSTSAYQVTLYANVICFYQFCVLWAETLTGVSVVEVAGCWRAWGDGSSLVGRWETGAGVRSAVTHCVGVAPGEAGAAVWVTALLWISPSSLATWGRGWLTVPFNFWRENKEHKDGPRTYSESKYCHFI